MTKTITTFLAALVVASGAQAARIPSPTTPSPFKAKVHRLLAKQIECSNLVDKAVATQTRDDLRRAVRCDVQLEALKIELFPRTARPRKPRA
jgi:hypothetical protein